MTSTLSVSQFLTLVNETLRTIPTDTFSIEGEISDFRIAQEKWVSFDLKDEKEQALLKCFMTVWQLRVPIENGMRVQVRGYPNVYERYGTFKFTVQDIQPVGEGALKRAYELLKKKLEEEGLFDGSRKRPLPRFPERIGLITSRDAAAFGDFMRILNNRWGGVEMQFFPVHVQGKEAEREIVEAFRFFNALSNQERPDVLVLTRGGGGLEELHAFNSEAVARAVFQSAIPVVVGVGHERDESLCDFVADVRASTPSNAAERVTPSRDDVLFEIENMIDFFEQTLLKTVREQQSLIERLMHQASFFLEREQQRFSALFQKFQRESDLWLPSLVDRVALAVTVLKQVDPKRILKRGYSLVRSNNAIVTNAADLAVGHSVHVQLARGSFAAEVQSIQSEGQQRLL